jgi:tol-pal system protein YbgF
LRLIAAALVAAAFLLPAAVQAQGRLSLSERVQRLEQQVQGQNQGQTTVELLNRLNELQTEVQNLRGMVEQQAFEIERLKKGEQDRYLDLDSRLNRLEGGPANPATAGAAQPLNPVATDPAAPTAPTEATVPPAPPAAPAGQLAVEAPEVAPPPSTPATTAPGTEAEPAQPAAPPPGVDEKAAYDDAFAALRDGRYAESARRFSTFLQQYPNGEFADNATYWLGESYYVTQNYRIALDTFSDLLRRFPQSAKSPDALLKVGYCHYEMREWAEAETALNQVVERYPDTTVARLAQGRLRALRLEGQR